MKSKLLASLLFTVVMTSSSQAHAKADLDEVTQKAQTMSKAMVKMDWEQYADYVAPIVVESLGGRAEFIKKMNKNTEQMTHEGSHIDDVEVSKPQRILGSGANLQAIVPMMITIRVPEGILKRKSFLVANSINSGDTWSFFDGAAIDQKNVSKLVPNVSESAKKELLEAAQSKEFHSSSFQPNKGKDKPTSK